MFFMIEWTQRMDANGGVLTAKGSDAPLRTASVDFSSMAGTLVGESNDSLKVGIAEEHFPLLVAPALPVRLSHNASRDHSLPLTTTLTHFSSRRAASAPLNRRRSAS